MKLKIANTLLYRTIPIYHGSDIKHHIPPSAQVISRVHLKVLVLVMVDDNFYFDTPHTAVTQCTLENLFTSLAAPAFIVLYSVTPCFTPTVSSVSWCLTTAWFSRTAAL